MDLLTLQTDRLQLRRLTDHNYDLIIQTLPDKEIMDILNIGSAEQLVSEKWKQQQGYATYNKKLLVFQLLDRQSLWNIGWCGCHSWCTDHCRAEIGYALTNQADRKKRLMSEALDRILAYGFEEMNLNRIEAFISPVNYASQNLVKKFKFRKEGVLRGHYFKNGLLEDSFVYGLLKSDVTTYGN